MIRVALTSQYLTTQSPVHCPTKTVPVSRQTSKVRNSHIFILMKTQSLGQSAPCVILQGGGRTGVTGSITQRGPRGAATIASLTWEKRGPSRCTKSVTAWLAQPDVVSHAAQLTISLVCAVLRCGLAGGADHPETPAPGGRDTPAQNWILHRGTSNNWTKRNPIHRTSGSAI